MLQYQSRKKSLKQHRAIFDRWKVKNTLKQTHRNKALIYSQLNRLLWLICKQTTAYSIQQTYRNILLMPNHWQVLKNTTKNKTLSQISTFSSDLVHLFPSLKNKTNKKTKTINQELTSHFLQMLTYIFFPSGNGCKKF